MVEAIRNQEKAIYEEFQKKLEQEGFAMIQLRVGIVARPEILPLLEGRPVGWDQLEKAAEKQGMNRARLDELRAKYTKPYPEMEERIGRVLDLERELAKRVKQLRGRPLVPL